MFCPRLCLPHLLHFELYICADGQCWCTVDISSGRLRSGRDEDRRRCRRRDAKWKHVTAVLIGLSNLTSVHCTRSVWQSDNRVVVICMQLFCCRVACVTGGGCWLSCRAGVYNPVTLAPWAWTLCPRRSFLDRWTLLTSLCVSKTLISAFRSVLFSFVWFLFFFNHCEKFQLVNCGHVIQVSLIQGNVGSRPEVWSTRTQAAASACLESTCS